MYILFSLQGCQALQIDCFQLTREMHAWVRKQAHALANLKLQSLSNFIFSFILIPFYQKIDF